MKLEHTPGPWEWQVNKTYKQVTLIGHRNGCRELVMDFTRWGMNGAKPRFNRSGLMHPADGLCGIIEGREHHASWCQTINHPDARLIAAAPDMLDALIEAYKFYREAIVDYGPCDHNVNICICPLIRQTEQIQDVIESATGKKIEEVLS